MTLPAASASPRYDVVALATSAGGLGALRAVLGALPADFPAAVLVMQHLGRYGSALVEILAEHARLPVAWVTEGALLAPGRVWVCPPQRMVDVGPDARVHIREGLHRAPAHPIDALFSTLAETVGPRAIAVVLTGLGRDGADGVRALGRAGATVLAQSEASAEYPAMPRAASASGAVDLVLPLDEIGPTLVRVVAGEPLPRSGVELAARAALFRGRGAAVVGPVLVEADWAATALGPVADWPLVLCAALRVTFASHVPMFVHWGEALVEFYNDAALAVSGGVGHAAAVGHPLDPTRAGPPTAAMLRAVLRTGEAAFGMDVAAQGTDGADPHTADAVLSLSCSAILDPDAAQGVGGVLTLATRTVGPAAVRQHP